MNYTKPNDENHETTYQELLDTTLIFARALSFTLKENQGIVVDVKGDVSLDNEKVIVYNGKDGKVHIINCDKDYDEGDIIKIST